MKWKITIIVSNILKAGPPEFPEFIATSICKTIKNRRHQKNGSTSQQLLKEKNEKCDPMTCKPRSSVLPLECSESFMIFSFSTARISLNFPSDWENEWRRRRKHGRLPSRNYWSWRQEKGGGSRLSEITRAISQALSSFCSYSQSSTFLLSLMLEIRNIITQYDPKPSSLVACGDNKKLFHVNFYCMWRQEYYDKFESRGTS